MAAPSLTLVLFGLVGSLAMRSGKGDVLAHGHVRIERVGLEHHGETAFGGRHVGGVLAVDLDHPSDVVSSRPAISRSSVDLPQPDGPTKTTNSPSSMSRSRGGNDVDVAEALGHLLEYDASHDLLPYFTAPKVRPRTSCFWLNHPRIRIGAIAMVEAAESLA